MGHTASSHSHGQWALPGLIEVRSQQDTGVLLQNQWLFGGRFATLLAGLGVSEGVRIVSDLETLWVEWRNRPRSGDNSSSDFEPMVCMGDQGARNDTQDAIGRCGDRHAAGYHSGNRGQRRHIGRCHPNNVQRQRDDHVCASGNFEARIDQYEQDIPDHSDR